MVRATVFLLILLMCLSIAFPPALWGQADVSEGDAANAINLFEIRLEAARKKLEKARPDLAVTYSELQRQLAGIEQKLDEARNLKERLEYPSAKQKADEGAKEAADFLTKIDRKKVDAVYSDIEERWKKSAAELESYKDNIPAYDEAKRRYTNFTSYHDKKNYESAFTTGKALQGDLTTLQTVATLISTFVRVSRQITQVQTLFDKVGQMLTDPQLESYKTRYEAAGSSWKAINATNLSIKRELIAYLRGSLPQLSADASKHQSNWDNLETELKNIYRDLTGLEGEINQARVNAVLDGVNDRIKTFKGEIENLAVELDIRSYLEMVASARTANGFLETEQYNEALQSAQTAKRHLTTFEKYITPLRQYIAVVEKQQKYLLLQAQIEAELPPDKTIAETLLQIRRQLASNAPERASAPLTQLEEYYRKVDEWIETPLKAAEEMLEDAKGIVINFPDAPATESLNEAERLLLRAKTETENLETRYQLATQAQGLLRVYDENSGDEWRQLKREVNDAMTAAEGRYQNGFSLSDDTNAPQQVRDYLRQALPPVSDKLNDAESQKDELKYTDAKKELESVEVELDKIDIGIELAQETSTLAQLHAKPASPEVKNRIQQLEAEAQSLAARVKRAKNRSELDTLKSTVETFKNGVAEVGTQIGFEADRSALEKNLANIDTQMKAFNTDELGWLLPDIQRLRGWESAPPETAKELLQQSFTVVSQLRALKNYTQSKRKFDHLSERFEQATLNPPGEFTEAQASLQESYRRIRNGQTTDAEAQLRRVAPMVEELEEQYAPDFALVDARRMRERAREAGVDVTQNGFQQADTQLRNAEQARQPDGKKRAAQSAYTQFADLALEHRYADAAANHQLCVKLAALAQLADVPALQPRTSYPATTADASLDELKHLNRSYQNYLTAGLERWLPSVRDGASQLYTELGQYGGLDVSDLLSTLQEVQNTLSTPSVDGASAGRIISATEKILVLRKTFYQHRIQNDPVRFGLRLSKLEPKNRKEREWKQSILESRDQIAQRISTIDTGNLDALKSVVEQLSTLETQISQLEEQMTALLRDEIQGSYNRIRANYLNCVELWKQVEKRYQKEPDAIKSVVAQWGELESIFKELAKLYTKNEFEACRKILESPVSTVSLSDQFINHEKILRQLALVGPIEAKTPILIQLCLALGNDLSEDPQIAEDIQDEVQIELEDKSYSFGGIQEIQFLSDGEKPNETTAYLRAVVFVDIAYDDELSLAVQFSYPHSGIAYARLEASSHLDLQITDGESVVAAIDQVLLKYTPIEVMVSEVNFQKQTVIASIGNLNIGVGDQFFGKKHLVGGRVYDEEVTTLKVSSTPVANACQMTNPHGAEVVPTSVLVRRPPGEQEAIRLQIKVKDEKGRPIHRCYIGRCYGYKFNLDFVRFPTQTDKSGLATLSVLQQIPVIVVATLDKGQTDSSPHKSFLFDDVVRPDLIEFELPLDRYDVPCSLYVMGTDGDEEEVQGEFQIFRDREPIRAKPIKSGETLKLPPGDYEVKGVQFVESQYFWFDQRSTTNRHTIPDTTEIRIRVHRNITHDMAQRIEGRQDEQAVKWFLSQQMEAEQSNIENWLDHPLLLRTALLLVKHLEEKQQYEEALKILFSGTIEPFSEWFNKVLDAGPNRAYGRYHLVGITSGADRARIFFETGKQLYLLGEQLSGERQQNAFLWAQYCFNEAEKPRLNQEQPGFSFLQDPFFDPNQMGAPYLVQMSRFDLYYWWLKLDAAQLKLANPGSISEATRKRLRDFLNLPDAAQFPAKVKALESEFDAMIKPQPPNEGEGSGSEPPPDEQ